MKLSSLFLAAALLAVSASPALAVWDWGGWNTGTSITNTAYIRSYSDAVSTTGNNLIEACNTCGIQPVKPSMFMWPTPAPVTTNYINSGAAGSGAASQVGGINLTSSLTGLKTVMNYASIKSDADASSNSGFNMIFGSGANTLVTGAASSLSESLVTEVNVTGFGGLN